MRNNNQILLDCCITHFLGIRRSPYTSEKQVIMPGAFPFMEKWDGYKRMVMVELLEDGMITPVL